MTKTLLNRRNLVKSESGVAMPAVILVVALLAIMAIGSVRTVGDEVKASTQMSESARAFYAAEAGIDLIIATWDSLKYDTLMPNPGDTAMLDWTSLPENGTAFRALLQRVDDGSGPAFSVRVQGRGGIGNGSTRNVSSIVRLGGGSAPFKWAIYGSDSVQVNNNADFTGPIGSNGDIDFGSNSPTIDGDVTAAGVIIGDQSGITGTVTENATPEDSLPQLPCPAIPYGPLPSRYKSWHSKQGHILISEDISGPKVPPPSVFTGGVYLFNNFTKESEQEIVIPPGETVIIYVKGILAIKGAGGGNTTGPAANLQIYGCGPNAGAWSIGGGGSTWNMAVYAPRHPLDLTNSNNIKGSFIGRFVEKSNNGTVTYDPSLETLQLPGGGGGGGAGGVTSIVKRTWTEF